MPGSRQGYERLRGHGEVSLLLQQLLLLAEEPIHHRGFDCSGCWVAGFLDWCEWLASISFVTDVSSSSFGVLISVTNAGSWFGADSFRSVWVGQGGRRDAEGAAAVQLQPDSRKHGRGLQGAGCAPESHT
eukprot:3449293-Rhodomonas_salina.1